MRHRLLVGTRGSALALIQANQVILAMKKIDSNLSYEVVTISTRGDKLHDRGATVIDGKSMYTEEIEEALAAQKIDIAVHSMKDLTTELPRSLAIAAVPERVNPRDVLISRDGTKFSNLPARTRVGTSSPRRKSQLLAARGDLEVLDMHGNVDTRLNKLRAGEFDAIVLAAAGLIRLGLEKKATEYLSTDTMLPAVGQGALAIETRENDTEVRELLSKIDHQPTRKAVTAERAFARRLDADCRTPVAAYARTESGKLVIDGLVATRNGSMLLKSRVASQNPNADEVGIELAEILLSKGASAILEAA
jgi:hydroxymethylbilane synthase